MLPMEESTGKEVKHIQNHAKYGFLWYIIITNTCVQTEPVKIF